MLKSELIEINQLSTIEKENMFKLMECYYDNIIWNSFSNDLAEKDIALLLKDDYANLRGFTTIKTYNIDVSGKTVEVIFSGDTIIDKEFWGELELHRAWINAVYSRANPLAYKVYWLLISKGYKTYRFLPIYFNSFYPCVNADTLGFEKDVMDKFCFMKYPENYDAEKGILCMRGQKDFLKKGVADITEKQLKNPHIRFFASRNPGYANGDELVCLAELSIENMKSMTLRYLGKG